MPLSRSPKKNSIWAPDRFRKKGRLSEQPERHESATGPERLGISTESLHTWKAQFAKSPRIKSKVAGQAAEIKRVKRELARVTEERSCGSSGQLNRVNRLTTPNGGD